MNRRAQIPVLGLLLGLLVFIVVWALWAGEALSYWGQQAIEINHLTGMEAFFWAYLNLWVLIGVVIGTLVFMYYSGGR
jgi:hypothetical protein